ncbi:hypothetical protein GCM10023185_41140 [Hymenobacter saemangeumensis]|uniref:Ferritin-like domain-containing protein n=1 Tax=Hymenobacter saemangeumensis TaxID=1084522 RepID=A0ABP8IR93_9BACT
MNLLSLLNRLSVADQPAAPAPAPRRQALRQLGQAVAAGLPLAMGAGSPAQAKIKDTALDAVQLLLRLEDLLADFYTQALAAPALMAAPFRADLTLLQTHQQNHAAFLRQTLRDAGVTPPPAPTSPRYDFSGRRGNPSNPILFPTVFTGQNGFLEMAQQLEDASAAIYQGQAAFIIGNRLLLDAVLRMQAVEARHAAHLRTLRRTLSGARVKSWPSRADAAPNPAIQVPSQPATTPPSTTSIYAFEANETQIMSGARLVPYATLLTGSNLVQTNALAEAFDEPLPTAQATALLNIFG